MKNKKLNTKSIIFAIYFALPVSISAQDGSLDLTFGNGGIIQTPVGIVTLGGSTSMVIQSDGKMILSGYSDNGSDYDFTVIRYNINGSLDSTFDFDGKVMTPIGSNDDVASSLAIQSDGKILVAGSTVEDSTYTSDFALVRYNINGSLDSSFGNGGQVTTFFGSQDDYALSIAIQSDGKILLAGYGSSFDTTSHGAFAIARFNTNGSLDSTFDTDGKLTTLIGALNDRANYVAIQSDGKILVAGCSYWDAGGWSLSDFALVRYNTNGSLDSSFNNNGIYTGYVNNNNFSSTLAIQSDGKILLAGSSGWTELRFTLLRFNTNGSIDNTFHNGPTNVMGTQNESVSSMALQSDGKIVLAGVGGGSDFLLVRYDSIGIVDSTFGYDGRQTTNIMEMDGATSVAIQNDGKIVAAGYSQLGFDNSNGHFVLVRYNNDITVGLNETGIKKTEITIYPNPTTGSIYLSEQSNITLSDLSGKLLLEEKNTKQLDLSALPAGMYFLSFGENNLHTYKVIKE